MAFSDTLLVRHLPALLSKSEIEDLMKHLGAIHVVIFGSNIKNRTAFAKFKSKNVAKEVLFRLHQQDIFGCRLVVEFAKSNEYVTDESQHEIEKQENDKKAKMHETFLRNLNNWTVGLNFTLPPPCHLHYQYPEPTANVLLNIVNLLSYCTKFYTQVLHLMNKMNLPSPFESSFPMKQNEVFNSFMLYILQNSVYEGGESSEEGSELESETEVKKVSSASQKRKRPLLDKKALQKRKLLKPWPVSSDTANLKNKAQMDEVFEQVERDPIKKIEVKIPSEISVMNPLPVVEETNSGFGIISPPEKPKDPEQNETEEETTERTISAQELAANRLSERDQKSLPVYKNYDPGVPSCRLYIKNLSKQVTVTDLQYIFRRYFVKGIDEQGTMFDIRLMQEGRMKGQAFVTLQNIKQAELARKETNGFIIKDKPMVVLFARSAGTK